MSIEQYPSANGVLTSLIWRKTAVGGETSLSGYDNASQALSYTPGQEQVYLNGILLVRGSDYTATNGTSITGLTALVVDDFIQINCYNNFSVASVPTASLTGTVTNAQLAGSITNDKLTNSSITINGSAVALGGSVSLAGDIESVTASTGLSGGGNTGALTLTNTMATAIAAKGDLIVGTGSGTFVAQTVGANGTVLTANSAQADGVEWIAPSGGSLQEQRFTSSGTFTVPTGVTKVWATVVGGGGGGNNGAGGTTYCIAWGGNAGAYITEQVTVTPSASISVVVGSGGTSHAAGGASSFGSLTAAGGAGGRGTGVADVQIGLNGESNYGIGGVGGNPSQGGAAAANSGAGGGGGGYVSGQGGGAGGSGIVIVRWLG